MYLDHLQGPGLRKELLYETAATLPTTATQTLVSFSVKLGSPPPRAIIANLALGRVKNNPVLLVSDYHNYTIGIVTKHSCQKIKSGTWMSGKQY